ncbi:MAG: transcription termination/antitermination factor NusG [Bacteroidaceae bacterium]|nr:transcription termination/antitermination factor NusG [Bacteroidaceae bacterium]
MADTLKKWFVLKAISGKESKVKEYIDLNVKNNHYEEKVTQVLVPTEKVQKTTNNKRIIKEKTLLSGYVLVEVAVEYSKTAKRYQMDGTIQSLLRNTPNVLGFLSAERGSNEPMPLRDSEVSRLLGASEEMETTIQYDFHIGDAIKVSDGPFSGFDGTIEEVNEEKKKLKVAVKIFGRITPVELDFTQVGKE